MIRLNRTNKRRKTRKDPLNDTLDGYSYTPDTDRTNLTDIFAKHKSRSNNTLGNDEDCVEYSLYPDSLSASEHGFNADVFSLSGLTDLNTMISAHLLKWTEKYIWQKDSFSLHVVYGHDLGPQKPFLRGRTRFADCVDDEWFIVFLLCEITRAFPFLTATVSDNDGEFLLVEAASHLPNWLDPTNATNRVFISQGRLHIIPLPKTTQEKTLLPSSPSISLQQALQIIQNQSNSKSGLTLASEDIEKSALQRCLKFKEVGVLEDEGFHRARCVVPRDIARILKFDPGLVASAVEAFYLRDPLQLKACQTMSRFPPSPGNLVHTTVRFTKMLYAQLASQQFYAPKPFRLPASNAPDFKAHELGMKLACGFEMLAADPHLMDLSEERAGDVSITTYRFDADPQWRALKERLTRLGYFKGEIPGSKLYKTLETTAKEHHIRQLIQSRARAGSSNKNSTSKSQIENDDEGGGAVYVSNPVDRLLLALREAPGGSSSNAVDDELIVCNEPEDSDSWLDVDVEALEREMLERAGGAGELTLEDLDDLEGFDDEFDDEVDDEDEDMMDDGVDDEEREKRKKQRALEREAERREVRNLQKVVKGFQSFVQKQSGVEGALFPTENDLEIGSDDEDELGSDGEHENEEELWKFLKGDSREMEEDVNKPLNLDMERLMQTMMSTF
ncbi:hypothetical protein HDU76_009949, partial [Blyttiomyces sp. JEL0837]